jgi:hypothetical protein
LEADSEIDGISIEMEFSVDSIFRIEIQKRTIVAMDPPPQIAPHGERSLGMRGLPHVGKQFVGYLQ